MPPVVPLDSTLTLGSVVGAEKQAALDRLAKQKAIVGAAKKKLEAATATLRSFDSMIAEVGQPSPTMARRIRQGRQAASQRVESATNDLLVAKLVNSDLIHQLQAEAESIPNDYESPVALSKSPTLLLPLATESIRMTCQFFHFGQASQQNTQLTDYVSSATRFLGARRSLDLATAVSKKVTDQRVTHTVAGTLIITATCTHKHVAVFEPLVLDGDKAVRLWNSMYPENSLRTTDPAVMIASCKDRPGIDDVHSISICSSAWFGSSFIGMVHVLGDPGKLAGQLSGLGDPGSPKFRRALLSMSNESHCNIISTGAIPSIGARRARGAEALVDQVLDVDALTNAYDDYIRRVRSGSEGVPIGFSVSSISREQIAQAWCHEHRPRLPQDPESPGAE